TSARRNENFQGRYLRYGDPTRGGSCPRLSRSRISVSKHLLPRQSRRLRRLGLDDPIHDPDHDEQDPSDDNEVDDDGEEISPRQDGTLLFGFYQGIGGDVRRQRDEVI